MSMMTRIAERHQEVHLRMQEAFIRTYLEITGLSIDDIVLVEQIVHENDLENFVIKTLTTIERKDTYAPSKKENGPREDTGNFRVGLDPAYVDPGSTGNLYCDRCGCWLGRPKQD